MPWFDDVCFLIWYHISDQASLRQLLTLHRTPTIRTGRLTNTASIQCCTQGWVTDVLVIGIEIKLVASDNPGRECQIPGVVDYMAEACL